MNIDDLKTKIISANSAYRSGNSIMTDSEYDDLLESYQSNVSDQEYSEFRDSLNEGQIEYGNKVKHPYIMGSLDKIKNSDEKTLLRFLDSQIKSKASVSAKVDGISCRISYRNGQLATAATRGDGYDGVDITDKIKYVKHVPACLKSKIDVDIRGELVILKTDMPDADTNRRNICAGLINRKEYKPVDISAVSFISYTILGDDFSKKDQFSVLEENGFRTAWHDIIDRRSITAESLTDLAKKEYDYDTDGLVLTDENSLNDLDSYRPKNAMAFKINELTAVSKIIDISWEGPSKDGVFCPVAVIEPVELGGSVISRVTMHNLDFIRDMNLMYGSTVEILKSGDIIPRITKLISNENTSKIEYMEECPSCGGKLYKIGVALKCVNHECPAQVVHRIKHFIKKLGVENASNATLENFGITSFKDLISFKPDSKYKSQVKFYDELVRKVFTRSKPELLTAMNFNGLSEILLGKIIDFYGFDMMESNKCVKHVFQNGGEETMISLAPKYFTDLQMAVNTKGYPDGIGSLTIDRFTEDLRENFEYTYMISQDSRWNPFSNIVEKPKTKGSICVTGSLKSGSRSKFLQYALEHGYESKSGVSRGLTFLVNNDAASNSSKNRKAKELGIRIISEDDFVKLIKKDEGNVIMDL